MADVSFTRRFNVSKAKALKVPARSEGALAPERRATPQQRQE